MKRNLGSAKRGRLDITPKWVDISCCLTAAPVRGSCGFEPDRGSQGETPDYRALDAATTLCLHAARQRRGASERGRSASPPHAYGQ
jgi:hypothetical protein